MESILSEILQFTHNWLATPNLQTLQKEIDTSRALSILECGTFEGRSAFYFLENFCQNKSSSLCTIDFITRPNLEHNLAVVSAPQLSYVEGDFFRVLPQLLLDNNQYDLIYLDGGKDSIITAFQVSVCWQMLAPQGILYFDDYQWGGEGVARPREAIDFFLSAYEKEYELIFKNSQVAVRSKRPYTSPAPSF